MQKQIFTLFFILLILGSHVQQAESKKFGQVIVQVAAMCGFKLNACTNNQYCSAFAKAHLNLSKQKDCNYNPFQDFSRSCYMDCIRENPVQLRTSESRQIWNTYKDCVLKWAE